MSSRGWIRLDRKLFDNRLWTEEPFTKGQAWVDLLLMASHKSEVIHKGNQIYNNRPGLVVTSIAKLSERWKWSRHKVSDYLHLLEGLGQISQKRTGKRTEVFLINWGIYQDAGTGKRTDKGQFEDSLRTVQGHNQECINKYNKGDGRGSEASPTTAASGFEKTGTAGAMGITGALVDEIVRLWNGVEHTANISGIAEGTERFVNLCDCLSLVGAEGITRAITKVRESEYLKSKGHVRFDSYMNPNAITKLLEGAYDENYGKKGVNYGLARDW